MNTLDKTNWCPDPIIKRMSSSRPEGWMYPIYGKTGGEYSPPKGRRGSGLPKALTKLNLTSLRERRRIESPKIQRKSQKFSKYVSTRDESGMQRNFHFQRNSSKDSLSRRDPLEWSWLSPFERDVSHSGLHLSSPSAFATMVYPQLVAPLEVLEHQPWKCGGPVPPERVKPLGH